MPKKSFLAALGILLGSALLTHDAEAQLYYPYREDTAKEMPDNAELTQLAKMLQNPVADLIQVPLLNSFDFGFNGDAKGFRYTLGINPVLPVAITRRVLMISKTELSILAQNELGGVNPYQQGGLGDTQQSFWFTQRNPGAVMFGAGPVLRLPTATDNTLGSEKWSVGPTAVVVMQPGRWTYGMMANYLISFAGDDDRPRYNRIMMQPFAAVVVGRAWAINVNTQTTYNFTNNRWNAPLIGSISKVVNLGHQTWGFSGQVMGAMANPSTEPDWGLRMGATLLFPGRQLATKPVARHPMAQKGTDMEGATMQHVVQSMQQASFLMY